MGLKGLMSSMGMDPFAMISLLLFFGSFVTILIWTYTRPKQDIESLSRLWEDDEQA